MTLHENDTSLIDIGIAALLSLATLASAWSVYQSSLWDSALTFRLVAAFQAGRTVTEKAVVAGQHRAFDASMLIEYMRARDERSVDLEKDLYDRFRPELRRAVDSWLATRPFENPDAPRHPFQPQWYELPEEREASRQQERGEELYAAAQEMNRISDTYVLLTVLFASVLFFGGMAGTFRSRTLELVFGTMALVLFLAVASFMLSVPVCRQCDSSEVVTSGKLEP